MLSPSSVKMSAFEVYCDDAICTVAAFFSKKPLVSASIFRFQGQITIFSPETGGPCYRCLYSEPPPAALVPS